MKIVRIAPLVAVAACTAVGFGHPKRKAKEPEAPPKPAPTVPMPDPAAVSAQSAVVLDGDTGRVLWSKDGDKQMFPASTTKIMTALLLLEHCKQDELITAPKDVNTVGESSMHLQPGEQLSMRNLLWGILLRSANDGCYDAAVHISGSVPEFAKLMNARALEIGCTHTHFTNPNGLHDKNHWTSAHDLTLMAREAFTYPVFAEMVRTRKHKIARSMNEKDTWMVSRNKYLDIDKTADGVKTGYTVPAGHTYVGSASRDGHRVITAIMKSDHWQLDNAAMLKWGFEHFDRVTVARKGDSVGSVSVEGGGVATVPAVLAADVHDCVPKGSGSPLKGTFQSAPVTAPVAPGQEIGTEIYKDDSGFSVKVPVVAGSAVASASRARGAATSHTLSYFVIGSTLCLGLFWFRSRTRRSQIYGTRKGSIFPFG